MTDVEWIKLSTDIFSNRKIKQIEAMPDGDSLIIIWIKLIVLAGEINDGGCIYFTPEIPYTDQLLATQFNRPLATIQLALQTFRSFRMIDIEDDVIHITNWERYQNVERLDQIREQTRARVAKHRQKKRLEGCNVTRNVTVTQCNATEREEEKEEDKEIIRESKERNAPAFTPPTRSQVRAFCQKRKNGVNPDRFFDYYSARGWKDIQDWEAALRAWETNGIDKKDSQPAPSYDLDGIMRSAMDFDPTKTNRGEV